ncbi:MAG: hypothetical protein LBC04_03985 [Holosporaceae bacterium]|nr:hypothetical protein [Holosporaceae bacterium]
MPYCSVVAICGISSRALKRLVVTYKEAKEVVIWKRKWFTDFIKTVCKVV